MRILFICAGNPMRNPRSSYLIPLLKQHHHVSVVGAGVDAMADVEIMDCGMDERRGIFQSLWLGVNLALKRWEKIIFNQDAIADFLKYREFDLIVCYDLILLPIVLRDKKDARVIFDASFPHQEAWGLKILFRKFHEHLCKNYLNQASKVTTISSGVKMLCEKYYKVQGEVFYSLLSYHPINPSIVGDHHIRLIYHGIASRATEKILALIEHLPEEYSLDLMLIFHGRKKRIFEKKIKRLQEKGRKISLIDPLAPDKIIFFLAHYDMGICILEDLALDYGIPEGFFEYIQARLALAIYPHQEMGVFLQRYQNGVASQEPSPESLAKAILTLDRQKIMQMKIKSHIAAQILNSKRNEKKFQDMMRALFLKTSQEEY